MNAGEIKTRILEGVNDDPDDPVFFSAGQLSNLVDEACEVLAEETQAIRRQALVPWRAGTGFYQVTTVDPDFMAPTRLWNHKTGQRLTCLSMTELDAMDTRWQVTTGSPEVWFPVSWDMFGVYPKPAGADGVFRLDYMAWPRSLMDDGDRSELPEATHDAVVLYGQYMGCLKKWDTQAAMIPLKALQLHKTLANARSGIARISVRSMQRSQDPRTNAFPSTYQVGG